MNDQKKNIGNPRFPPSIYDALPEKLRVCTDTLEAPEEKDIFLLSSLCAISGILFNVSGKHLGQTVYPMLYSFVIAPPASHKSVMRNARRLIHPIHLALKETGKNLIMGGNTSGAAMIKFLQKNNGQALIFETESDALAKVLTQDFAKDVSTMLRMGFHHEPITVERKELSIEIELPKLAIVISSTPNQVGSLITSVGDGLFSRFAFYSISRSSMEWKDLDDTQELVKYDIATACDEFGLKILDCWKATLDKTITILRTPEQRTMCDEYFIPMAKEVANNTNENMPGVLRRLGLVNRRIAMVLAWIRKMDSLQDPQRSNKLLITITDQDMKTALALTKVLFRHSEALFENMPEKPQPKKRKADTNAHRAMNLYSVLPENQVLTRREIIDIIQTESSKPISESTIDKRLRYLMDCDLFESDLPLGHYKKKQA